ncbi:small leucine-rich protein 1 [Anomaloglossus baeobatrachus]|uniref:small leucine-rich protein 1 n=1 Tax=Anomaloglossus baeobatrachus TaxID=238106 RepID=UPI003F50B79F
MGHIISVLVKELPITYIFGGIFLPVALLLLSLISYLRIKLEEVNEELAQIRAPRDSLRDYNLQYERLKSSKSQRVKRTS